MGANFHLILYVLLSSSLLAVPKLPVKTEQKINDLKDKITALSPADFSSYLTEINQLRTKIDELSEQMLRECYQQTAVTVDTCIATGKAKSLEVWKAYFSSRQKFLATLQDFFGKELNRQAISTEAAINEISPSKTREKNLKPHQDSVLPDLLTQ